MSKPKQSAKSQNVQRSTNSSTILGNSTSFQGPLRPSTLPQRPREKRVRSTERKVSPSTPAERKQEKTEKLEEMSSGRGVAEMARRTRLPQRVPMPGSKQQKSRTTKPSHHKSGPTRILLPSDLQGPGSYSPEVLWSDGGEPFPKKLMRSFRAFPASRRIVKDLGKDHNRILGYLREVGQWRNIDYIRFDSNGTLSHLLLLSLADFEVSLRSQGRKLPAPQGLQMLALPTTDTELIASLSLERHREVRSKKRLLQSDTREETQGQGSAEISLGTRPGNIIQSNQYTTTREHKDDSPEIPAGQGKQHSSYAPGFMDPQSGNHTKTMPGHQLCKARDPNFLPAGHALANTQ